MIVDEFLSASAARSPEHTALVCGDRRWSYGEVDRASDRAAVRFSEAGAQHGDRIAICLDNPCETVVALFGALKAGCAFVIVNAQARPDYISRVVADSGARILVDRRAWHPAVLRTGSPALAGPTRSDSDLAALVYTSGSTGEPKGVMLTHRNITSAGEAISTYLDNTADDVI